MARRDGTPDLLLREGARPSPWRGDGRKEKRKYRKLKRKAAQHGIELPLLLRKRVRQRQVEEIRAHIGCTARVSGWYYRYIVEIVALAKRNVLVKVIGYDGTRDLHPHWEAPTEIGAEVFVSMRGLLIPSPGSKPLEPKTLAQIAQSQIDRLNGYIEEDAKRPKIPDLPNVRWEPIRDSWVNWMPKCAPEWRTRQTLI